MNRLVHDDNDHTIDRILDDKKRRGRPRQQPFHILALIETVMREHEHEGYCVSDAIRWIDRNRRDHRTIDSLKNHHSIWAPYYEMWRRPIFVPGDLLANDLWRRPDEKPPLIPWHLFPVFRFVKP